MIWDLIALGETMVAFSPPPGESLRTAVHVAVDHAGAESNTCVGLSRLGFRVAWVSRVGVDSAGDRIIDALDAERVATSWVRRDTTRPTGLMLKEPSAGVRYCRSGSAASAMTAADLEGVPVESARAVLVTGITALIGPGPHAAGLALLSRAKGSRIVDPNLRDGLWGSERRAALVRTYIERCDLLLGGADELREILANSGVSGVSPTSADEALAYRAAGCGPREIVVRGTRAVGALCGGVWCAVAVDRRDAIDPVGAGDAFNAGYIAVRLRGGPIEDALRAGVRCGNAVTTTPSDTSAFPRTLA
jgi:2-dehydro-3-deoxygluconokinase